MTIKVNKNRKALFILIFLIFSINSFAQTVDYTFIPYRKAEKWGYANAERSIVISPKYSEVKWFSEGLAAVKIGTKWGYINKSGKLVIPARYTVAKSFRKGFVPNKTKDGGDSIIFTGASLVASGYEICINKKGVVLPKCPAIAENSVAENRIPIETIIREKTYSIANNNGLFDKITDDYKVAGSNETFYIAQKANLYGVFNSKFETIVPFEYNNITKISTGGVLYLQLKKSELDGLIKADTVISNIAYYNNLMLVKGIDNKDYIIVQKDGNTYLKDINNNNIIPTGYANMSYDENGGFILTDKSNLRGFYFTENKFITPKYADIRIVNKGSNYLQIKTTSGKTGYINSTGDEFFEE